MHRSGLGRDDKPPLVRINQMSGYSTCSPRAEYCESVSDLQNDIRYLKLKFAIDPWINLRKLGPRNRGCHASSRIFNYLKYETSFLTGGQLEAHR